MKTKELWFTIGVLTLILIILAYFKFSHQKTEVMETKQEPIDEVYQSSQECSYLEERIALLEEKFLRLKRKPEQQASEPVTKTTLGAPDLKTEPEPVKLDEIDISHVKNDNGDIIFCVMANNDGGMHFPQYAIERNVTFSSTVSNTTRDGTNWSVVPTESMQDDYGITHDGTFYVRHEIIQKTLSETLANLAIKSEFTQWQPLPMTKENGYWIYKTR